MVGDVWRLRLRSWPLVKELGCSGTMAASGGLTDAIGFWLNLETSLETYESFHQCSGVVVWFTDQTGHPGIPKLFSNPDCIRNPTHDGGMTITNIPWPFSCTLCRLTSEKLRPRWCSPWSGWREPRSVELTFSPPKKSGNLRNMSVPSGSYMWAWTGGSKSKGILTYRFISVPITSRCQLQLEQRRGGTGIGKEVAFHPNHFRWSTLP